MSPLIPNAIAAIEEIQFGSDTILSMVTLNIMFRLQQGCISGLFKSPFQRRTFRATVCEERARQTLAPRAARQARASESQWGRRNRETRIICKKWRIILKVFQKALVYYELRQMVRFTCAKMIVNSSLWKAERVFKWTTIGQKWRNGLQVRFPGEFSDSNDVKSGGRGGLRCPPVSFPLLQISRF